MPVLRDGVGDDDGLKVGRVDPVEGGAGEDAVRQHSVDLGRAGLQQLVYKQFVDKMTGVCLYVCLPAAWQMVPQVSAMSSTRMATLSLASPTSTMLATSLAFLRSLWIRANSTLSLKDEFVEPKHS